MKALRILTAWLLIVAGSGTGPVAATCAERATESRCTDMCKRCWCKRHSSTVSFRAVCPCCQPPHDVAPLTLLPPAVLPDHTPALTPPAEGAAGPAPAMQAASLAVSVPHPPPRTRLLS